MTTFICEKCGGFFLEIRNEKSDKVKVVCPLCLGKGKEHNSLNYGEDITIDSDVIAVFRALWRLVLKSKRGGDTHRTEGKPKG